MQLRQKVERIGFSGRHLLGLIEEILTFARLEAGEEKVESDAVDPGRILVEVEAQMEPLAIMKGIDFKCDRPSSLVANAIKFEPTANRRFGHPSQRLDFSKDDASRGLRIRHVG